MPQAIKNALLQSGAVTSITTSSSPATGVNWHSDVDNFPGKNAWRNGRDGHDSSICRIILKPLGMQLKEGHDFIGNAKADSANVILNEAGVKRLRLTNPVGQIITEFGRKMNIIGVVKDALMDSPFQAADPTFSFLMAAATLFTAYRQI
jgi:putative ABC transport system permease protein